MKHKIISILSIAALSLTSCTTIDPYTGQKKTSNTVKGAAIGTLGGAALGALIGNTRGGGKSRDYAIKGAIAGLVGGAGVGNYMDTQEALMRNQLRGTGVSVSRVGNDLVLNMPSDVTFNSGRSAIQPQFTDTLGSVAAVLKKYARTRISITGHTDSVGSASYNQGLSISRARSVASFLNSRGIKSGRILSYGQGESSPIASNNTSAGKAKNRRVEIRIVPEQGQY